ncbi:MAG: hypothetical protein WC322_00915, partial [Candidatus Paceibacterota bacterium]
FQIKEDCYSNIGIAKKDLSVCDKIQSQGLKEICYLKVDPLQGALLGCERKETAGEKNLCYQETAISNLDLSICSKIKGESESCSKDFCLLQIAVMKKDASICEGLQERLKDQCYYGIALFSQDYSVCADLSSEESRDLCRMDVASAKKDPLACEAISDSLIKEACLEASK